MTTLRPGAPCALGPVPRCLPVAVAALLALAACTSTPPPEPTSPPPTASPTATPSPPLTPRPTPTAAPTPRFTNEPDPELAALIPTEANGVPITIPPIDAFGLTPGDVGTAFGELGNRFASLAVAFIGQPRTTLYALRVDGAPVTTAELDPHLATAGRYVGIAGLHREPWQQATVGANLVWVRPEDNATAAGTMIYTWAAGEYLFLLIGVDDAINQAIVAALPGEPPPTPPPAPSGPAPASPAQSASPTP
jgi:hypothetical protein